MNRLLIAVLLLAGCTTLRPVKRAFTPYRPTPACIRLYACKQLGWCDTGVQAVWEGDQLAIYKDAQPGSRSERVYLEAWPYCKENR